MSKDLIFNPPTHEAAKAVLLRTRKTQKFQITPLVRSAIQAALADSEHYAVVMSHYGGGKVTGSKLADGYFLAEKLVEWEAADGRPFLHDAIADDRIRLNDIVKRLAPEMRKSGMAIEGNVCTGLLLK